MFRAVTLSGTGGSIVWGYRTNAHLRRWAIARPARGHAWTLTGTVDSLDARLLTKSKLLFTAPRSGRCGLWCFPVVTARVDVNGAFVATLNPPEY